MATKRKPRLSLKQYKDKFGRKKLRELAEDCGSSIKYFDKYATDVPTRRPNSETCKKIIELFPRLFSRESLRPDLYD